MTIGGDKLDYHDDTASPAASLLETKFLINSVISDHKNHNSKFCSIDIKDFFSQHLWTDRNIYEYIKNIFPMNLKQFTNYKTKYIMMDLFTVK